MAVPPNHLDLMNIMIGQPSSISQSIKLLCRQRDGNSNESTSLSQQEVEELQHEVDQTTELKLSENNQTAMVPYTVKGEGTSGNKRQSELVVQSKEVLEPDQLEQGIPDVSSEKSFNQRFEVDDHPLDELQIDTPNISLPKKQSSDDGLRDFHVTQQDLTDLADVLEQQLNEKINTVKVSMETHVAAQGQTIKTLQQVVNSLSKELSDTRILLNKVLSNPQTITTSLPSPKETALTTKLTNPTKSPRSSVIEMSSQLADRITIVSEFLKENPTYPKVKIVRKAKMKSLATKLQFELPEKELLPSNWNPDGLLGYFA